MKKIAANMMCSDRINPSDMGIVSAFSSSLSTDKSYVSLLGFCDVHVHFREPGFSYKATVSSESRASARGGYTAVCTMPNLNPVPDSVENLKAQLDIIERDSVIDVYPYAAITVGEAGETLSDMEGLAKDAIAFSDDGKANQWHACMEHAEEQCH